MSASQEQNTVPHGVTSSVGTADVDLAELDVPLLKRLVMSPSFALSVAIGLFVIFGLTQSAQFANAQSWINILRDATLIAIPAAFACIVLVSGGLDLSVGSVLVAGAMTAAATSSAGLGAGTAFLAGTLVGAGVGLINGFFVNFAKIPPIIVTLGSLFAVRAAVVASTGGNPIGPLPADFTFWGQGVVFGIPVVIILGLVVVVIAHLVLSQTNYGWSIRALGGNLNAARSAGIAVRKISISVYVLSGAAAAFTGAVLAARLGSGSPTFGQGYELQVIAAAVIGREFDVGQRVHHPHPRRQLAQHRPRRAVVRQVVAVRFVRDVEERVGEQAVGVEEALELGQEGGEEGAVGGGGGAGRCGTAVPDTRYTRIGREMFLRACSPMS